MSVPDQIMITKWDPFAGESYQVPWSPVELADVAVVHMVAEFFRVKDATEFRERYLSGSGKSWEGNVSQSSRTVRWDALTENTGPEIHDYVWSLAENVGCVGNHSGRRARVGFSRFESSPKLSIMAPTSY